MARKDHPDAHTRLMNGRKISLTTGAGSLSHSLGGPRRKTASFSLHSIKLQILLCRV